MNYYYGTARERGVKAIKLKKLPISQGDDHWLGDGVYFYDNIKYAYRWIWMMCEDKIKKNPSKDVLLDNYMVIVANINIVEGRLWDLVHNPEHFLLFNELRTEILKKNNQGSEMKKRVTSKKIVDGVVLNILFNEYGFGEEFDAVLYSFRTKSSSASLKTRIDIHEIQLCVKNPEIITGLCECTNYNHHDNIQFIYAYNNYKKGARKNDKNKNDIGRKSSLYQRIFKQNASGRIQSDA